MPHGLQVRFLSRAPDYDNFDYFRQQGDFLLPSSYFDFFKHMCYNIFIINKGASDEIFSNL